MPLPAVLSDASQADIQSLVIEQASETSRLDFKRQLPTNWNQEEKKNFMADVVAFANAGGGDIIYGIEESDARAAAIIPQLFTSVDVEVRRLQEFFQDLVEPRLQGVVVQPVPVTVGADAGHVVVVRIPQSWVGPHRSKVNSHFYVRDGARNRQLDLQEVRDLFLRADTRIQRMRDFRAERLSRIVTGQMPAELGSGPKLVVHAISLQAMLGQTSIPPVVYTRGGRSLPSIGDTIGSRVGLNLDGAFVAAIAQSRPVVYVQQFREGHFEAVWALQPLDRVPEPALPERYFENSVNEFLRGVRGELEAHNISQEIAVFLSLLGANQVVFLGPGIFGDTIGSDPRRFDRQDILLPEVLVDAESTVGKGMRPAYDLMCQAAGLACSPYYGEDGEWR